ncbi:MAG: DMT family transporter [Oceanospirillaceae bacterium]|jgi:drug/metabolite transporter (DMT)-like permease|nr:DMT family transporter [Oceanospirillaceae bacterium]MBT4443685.1 DMT family transporter [Oceanospirillaceae bacterium]MBT6077579.1 DMT family transporter [Oceanospirillaceae bacterium]MBT7330507.1 DMT family transporter [Oceanospirillaceae bacterium]
MERQKVWVAYAWMAFGAICLTLADFSMKQVAITGVHPATGFAMATPVSVLLLILLAKVNGGVAKHLAPKYPKALAMRGLFMIGMSYFNFIGLSYNPYSQQVMILQLGPILAALLAVFWLKEVFSKHQLCVAFVCLLGVWFIIDPRFGSGTVYLLLALAAAFFNALANIFVARHRDKATPIGFTFYGMLITVTVSVVVHLVQEFPMPDTQALIWLQVMGGLAVLGLASVSKALQLAASTGKAGTVGLMLYIQMPVALVIGYWVYAEQPSLMALLGAGLIIAAGMSLPLRAGVSSLR